MAALKTWISVIRLPPTTFVVIRRIITPSISFLIAAGVLLSAVLFFGSGNQDNFTTVDVEWSENIRRLGIEPFYPPQEDIFVGDLYADVVPGSPENIGEWPFTSHTVKLAHIDLTEELQENYSKNYNFPDTLPRDAPDEIWKQSVSDQPIFASTTARKSLPLVLFPGLTIARTRTATSGLSGALARFGGYIGVTKQEDQNIDLRIPFAETYGITSIPATRRLAMYCVDKLTKAFCTDKFVRNQLSMIIGKKIFEKISGKDEYKFNVELMLIRSVYLARAIESVSSNDVRSSIDTQAKNQTETVAKITDSANSIVRSAKSTAAGANDPQVAKSIDEQQARLQELVGGLPRRGVAATARSVDGHRVIATQVFQRPLAFGFRAVRFALEP